MGCDEIFIPAVYKLDFIVYIRYIYNAQIITIIYRLATEMEMPDETDLYFKINSNLILQFNSDKHDFSINISDSAGISD